MSVLGTVLVEVAVASWARYVCLVGDWEYWSESGWAPVSRICQQRVIDPVSGIILNSFALSLETLDTICDDSGEIPRI